jgi:hypothetical protein
MEGGHRWAEKQAPQTGDDQAKEFRDVFKKVMPSL